MQFGGLGTWELIILSAICLGPAILAVVAGLVIILFKTLDSRLNED